MPELPEVETIARGLSPELAGRTITAVDVRYPGAVLPVRGGQSRLGRDDGGLFARRVTGRTLLGARRRAKLLLIDLSPHPELGDLHLVTHLKMSGCMWLPPAGVVADTHTHIVFSLDGGLDNGRELHFRDPRKFGYCLALTSAELAGMDFYASLGPEPLEISKAAFVERFRAKRAGIKALLLNQSMLAGVGNIYADEALFRARIHPATKASEVSAAQLGKLHAGLQHVLAKAIAENGSSFSDYVDHKGDSGGFQNLFQVYGKKGEPCPRCGKPLLSAVVAGRTSVFCGECSE